MPFHGSWPKDFRFTIPQTPLPSCSGYLLLSNKSPPNLVASNNNHFIVSHDLTGQKFLSRLAGQLLCFTHINSGHLVIFSWWWAGLESPHNFFLILKDEKLCKKGCKMRKNIQEEGITFSKTHSREHLWGTSSVREECIAFEGMKHWELNLTAKAWVILSPSCGRLRLFYFTLIILLFLNLDLSLISHHPGPDHSAGCQQ